MYVCKIARSTFVSPCVFREKERRLRSDILFQRRLALGYVSRRATRSPRLFTQMRNQKFARAFILQMLNLVGETRSQRENTRCSPVKNNREMSLMYIYTCLILKENKIQI